MSDPTTHILVRGAKEHNLKNVSLDIPRDQFVVITGLSGSGKSSLAFDTLYAEGQRRYVESLSPYARQFLGMMEKPEVESIEGLSPAISIEQKTIGHNPRSTVGTVTEVYDYIRLLYARVGTQFCVDHPDTPVQKQTFEYIHASILEDFDGRRIQILAPVVKGRKGHYRELFEQLRKQGFTRVRVDGKHLELVPDLKVDRYKIHNIEIVVDRLQVSADAEQRLSESLKLGLQWGEETLIVLSEEPGIHKGEHLYSQANACAQCNASYPALAPNAFSFNSPYGSCPSCNGLGVLRDFNKELMFPDRNLTIRQGGIAPAGKKRSTQLWTLLEALCKAHKVSLDTKISALTDEFIETLLKGTGNRKIQVQHTFASGKRSAFEVRFPGIIAHLRSSYASTSSSSVRTWIESYMSEAPCNECDGGRLREESLHVRIGGKNITDIVHLSLTDCHDFFANLKLSGRDKKIAGLVLKEIQQRLSFLCGVGLQYLTLNRAARTLSGGESQRIRLAAQIGSQLTGVMYVLDEPSIGLHQHDNRRLINSLKELKELGNSVVVVEHDKEMIEQADFVVDLGPRAGVHGGELVAVGTPEELLGNKIDKDSSLTLEYLTGQKSIGIQRERRESNGNTLVLKGAKGNNLQNVTVEFPLQNFICVTGMSGSGKSTLINGTLYPILNRHFYRANAAPMAYDTIEGLEHIDKVIEIDQSPIGRTPRSNPATYTGLFTHIRDLYANLPESKIRGYKPGRFSFNVAGGRCDECSGDGVKKIEMNFLPDVYVQCDTCNGQRYNKETLQITYRGKSISDVLNMTVDQALAFFKDHPPLKRKLGTLEEVGLGYIHLGQQATTLSGGEAQRVKLASELSKIGTGNTLYILDEPTTGLHFEDINVLLRLLHKLVDRGNTVLVIEHNLDIVKTADHIIDLGPGGGIDGGTIVATGSPQHIAETEESLTGKYLREELV